MSPSRSRDPAASEPTRTIGQELTERGRRLRDAAAACEAGDPDTTLAILAGRDRRQGDEYPPRA